MAAAKHRPHGRSRGRDHLLRNGLHVDPVERLDVQHPAHDRRHRDHHQLVLIGGIGAHSFLPGDTDDAERHTGNAHPLAKRQLPLEQLLHDERADDCDAPAVEQIILVDESPGDQGEVARPLKVGGGAEHPCRHRSCLGLKIELFLHNRSRAQQTRRLLPDRLPVADGERISDHAGAAQSAGFGAGGADHQQVSPQPIERTAQGPFRAGRGSDQDHYRGDPDRHAADGKHRANPRTKQAAA